VLAAVRLVDQRAKRHNKAYAPVIDCFAATDDPVVLADAEKLNQGTHGYDIPYPDDATINAKNTDAKKTTIVSSVKVKRRVRVFVYAHDRSMMPRAAGSESLANQLERAHVAEKRDAIIMNIMQDFYTLGATQGFVGTLSSNFGCSVYLVRVRVLTTCSYVISFARLLRQSLVRQSHCHSEPFV
jgi:hypothetical protein